MKLIDALKNGHDILISNSHRWLVVRGERWFVYNSSGIVYYDGKDEEAAVDALINGTVHQSDGTVARKEYQPGR